MGEIEKSDSSHRQGTGEACPGATVSDGDTTVAYAFLCNSPVVGGISLAARRRWRGPWVLCANRPRVETKTLGQAVGGESLMVACRALFASMLNLGRGPTTALPQPSSDPPANESEHPSQPAGSDPAWPIWRSGAPIFSALWRSGGQSADKTNPQGGGRRGFPLSAPIADPNPRTMIRRGNPPKRQHEWHHATWRMVGHCWVVDSSVATRGWVQERGGSGFMTSALLSVRSAVGLTSRA
jgi:hypothetical protein